jgi:hypothetical protein
VSVAGIDLSTHFVDVVKLDEDTDRAEWHRFELHGQDAFERARSVARSFPGVTDMLWDDVVAIGVEDPRGYGAGSLYRVQGAVLSRIPARLLVQPWIPSAWRKQVGLPGNAPKHTIRAWVDQHRVPPPPALIDWPQDACDAYCIALATRQLIQITEAA